MEVGNTEEQKRQSKAPREDEIVNYNEDILGALEKLNKGKTVFVCSKKLSILMRRYGGAACVRIIRWRGKSIFRVDPLNES
ncbi:MAG: hypothetical protein QW279_14585 [Candidatus Jordarchaeaceae archaeon]